ncbi:MAG: hypothetical protein QM759_17065 [Terricaulis sp.]
MSMAPPDQAGPTMGSSAMTRDSDTIPSFISAKDLARGDKLFFGAGRRVRRVLGFLTVFVLVSALAIAFVMEQGGERVMSPIYDSAVSCSYDYICTPVAGRVIDPVIVHPKPRPPPPTISRAQFRANMLLHDRLLMSWQLSPWVLGATAIPLFFWLLACVFRSKAARVAALNLRSTRAQSDMRKMMRRELRPYGYVIAPCPKSGHDADVDKFAASLRHRFALNVRTLFANHATLSPSAGPAVTDVLARSSDVVIVDLSNGAPSDWSLIQPQAARCVFVSAWGQHEQAEAVFAGLNQPGQCFFYAPDGEIQRRGQFRAAMLAAMRAAHA